RKLLAKATGILAASVLVLTACGGDDNGADNDAEGAGDQDAEFLTIATGGSSGVYYQVGATVSDLLEDELGSDSSVQATGASADNSTLPTDANAGPAFTMGDANGQALEGSGPFEDDAREGRMAIAALSPNTVQVVATTESGIESIDGLAGRNVAVGDVGSGVGLNAQPVFDASDMSYDDIEA